MSGWHELGSGMSGYLCWARPHIASFPPHLLCSVSVSVSLSRIPGNLYMTKSYWLVMIGSSSFSILFWILFDNLWCWSCRSCYVKGPQGASVGSSRRGWANASICLHFWHNVSKYFAHNTQGETILSQLISDEPRDGDIDRDSNVPDTCPQGTIYTVFCPDILQSPDTGWGQGEVILMIFTAPVSWTNQS